MIKQNLHLWSFHMKFIKLTKGLFHEMTTCVRPSQCSAEAAFLRHCRTNSENDAAKNVPVGHLAHIIFGLSQDFESLSCVENSHAKNNFVFLRNSRSCNGWFDWCIGFLKCTGTSTQ